MLRRCEPLIQNGSVISSQSRKTHNQALATMRIRDQCFLIDGLTALRNCGLFLNAPGFDRLTSARSIQSKDTSAFILTIPHFFHATRDHQHQLRNGIAFQQEFLSTQVAPFVGLETMLRNRPAPVVGEPSTTGTCWLTVASV